MLSSCGSSSSPGQPTGDSGPPSDGGSEQAPPVDSGQSDVDAGPPPVAPSASNIKHLVVVVQENHSFDTYFGNYCTGTTGSNPTCNTGPACCEAAPTKDPGSGDSAVVLNDTENAAYDPDHEQVCELVEIDNGKMDQYVTGPDAGAGCMSQKNFAAADQATVGPYWNLAMQYALADRYFQPIAGQSSSNDMYLARAGFVFTDNSVSPKSIGAACAFGGTTATYMDQTIGDLLVAQNVPWGWYSEGYQTMIDAQKQKMCPPAPADCAAQFQSYPCVYDPSDVPFEYYSSFLDNPKYMFDYAKLAEDVAAAALPSVAFVKGLGYHSEHPGYGDTVSAGTTFVTSVVNTVEQSMYAADTLILITFDESGGFFDHIAPPAASSVDNKPYGPRIPLIAVGTFAKKNFVSHVQMEHSSIVKFIEWNWLSQKTGQLATRDAAVNNIGSMLDPAATGTAVPEQ
jgi:phospholipase C